MISQEVLNTFWNALDVTAKGMLGIFVFMGLFYMTIVGLDKLFPYKPDEEDHK